MKQNQILLIMDQLYSKNTKRPNAALALDLN